ncbi:helicase-exonuclease AddAB subunit AddB [Paenibacillus sp. IB182496]|uniref:ATP-dependent helicase/deoxyribonuclease subunit B n=1 Tax=Paenibacillus sabuli TaxID=2772509 RepID=A0A927BQM3_9BACL|nr:helicase-exonuclease AddAB subunit AddB [Paenibacillus sabuli]MBD2844462.1 helicase-exonuclease AddAB subunit AddB [Paenibacillus sabuli]
MLRFVLGRAGAGKTTRCLGEIRERLHASAQGSPLLLLVPEQATFQTEYALLRQAGLTGTMRAQVLSFRRLAYRVMQETGGAALTPIGETGKQMLLYKIVQRLEDELQLLRGAAQGHGFIERLSELMTEWKRYGIEAPAVREYAEAHAGGSGMLGRKLHDLQLIGAALERELDGHYLEAEDYLHRLAAGCEQTSALREAELWIDGFHGFTPHEYLALGALLRTVGRVTVTLCLDRPYDGDARPHELDLFHKTAETYIALRALAETSGVELEPVVRLDASPPRFAASPMLAHIERSYERPGAQAYAGETHGDPADPRCGVSVHGAVHRRAEVEAAARDMLRRVREQGLRWRDMALLVRTGGDYNDLLEQVLGDYDIPYFLDHKRPMRQHPLLEFIRSALETVTQGWRYDAVFRCIKSELLLPLDGELSREDLDRLENYVLAAGIDGRRRWLDAKRWRPLQRASLEDELPAEPGRAELAAHARILDAREAVVAPLRRFERALRGAADAEAMCRALYRLLEHVGAADRLEQWSAEASAGGELRRAREHVQLWEGVMGTLDQLAEMMGTQPLSPELFAGIVEAGLDGLKLATVPPALDQVLVGSMERTRAEAVEVCYLLGAGDGVLPLRMEEDGILTEQERQRLAADGLVMAPGIRRRLLDERFLIYTALTVPRSHLWISYPLADDEGKSLRPSEVLRQLRQLLPGVPERVAEAQPRPGADEAEQEAYIGHPGRTLSHLFGQLSAWRQGANLAPLWWEVYNWFAGEPQWRDRLALLALSQRFANAAPPLPGPLADQLYGERLRTSVSRMERFVSCPFQHFASHGLRLRERERHQLGAPDIGQLFHAALSRLTAELGDAWGTLPEPELRRRAAAVVDALAPRLQSQILLSSGRFRYMASKLREIVAQAALMLGEHARRATFRPVGVEVGFGGDGALPPLVLPLAGSRELEIVGRIDRVDAAQTDEGLLLRVLDYKSSATSLQLEAVMHGLSLQMLTYLDVLLTHAPKWLGQPAAPAGVLYFHVHNPLLAATRAIDGAEAHRQRLKRFKPKGLLLADEQAVRLMDGSLESGHSDLLPVAIKKDGSFYSASSVARKEEWDVLRRSVRSTIRRIGRRITGGEIAIEPYRMGGKTPCTHCAYKPVCQFDPMIEGNGYVKLGKSTKDEVWRGLTRQAEEGGAADDDAAE